MAELVDALDLRSCVRNDVRVRVSLPVPLLGVDMLISSDKIKAFNPCNEGWSWYLDNASHITDLKELLLRVDAKNPEWCRWLFTRLMTREQCIEIAIFSAEQVVGEYERKYPNDARPRNAIDAAKAVLKSDTEENREKAYAAAYAAYYAAAANAADAAANAANAAWFAANAAAYAAAANAAAAAACVAWSAVNAAAMRHRIITEAVKILDRGTK
jgi:hypothetical protein